MKHKQLIIAGVVTSALAGSLLAFGSAYAAPNGPGNFAERFAQRFNLDSNEVQNFMDEEHQSRHQAMEQARDSHLQALVDAGTITTEQRDVLVEKIDALHNQRDSLRQQGVTGSELHDKMEELRNELEQWAESQGLDLDAMRPDVSHGRGRGMHHKQ